MTSVPSVSGEWGSRKNHLSSQRSTCRHANRATFGFQEEPNWRVRSRSRAFINTRNEMTSVEEDMDMTPRPVNNFTMPSEVDGNVGVAPRTGRDVVSPSRSFPHMPPAAWFSSASSCSTCQLAQELVRTQQLQNEALVKSLSRILGKLGRMSQSVGDLERHANKMGNTEGQSAALARRPSSTIACGDLDEEDLRDIAEGMYPVSSGSATALTMISELKKAVLEVKEICHNSANLCFNGLGPPSTGFIGSQSSNRKSRLVRGNTITALPRSSAPMNRRTSSTTQGYGLDPGFIMQQRISPASSINQNPSLRYIHMHSVVDGRDEWVESLRRTHSDSELSSSNLEVCLGLDESLKLDSSMNIGKGGTGMCLCGWSMKAFDSEAFFRIQLFLEMFVNWK